MELSPTLRVTSAPVSGDIVRPVAPVANAAPVKTDLPPAKAVTQPGEIRPLDLGHAEGPLTEALDSLDRQISIDLETKKVVYQAIDEETGDVILQIPDPRLLKAYADQRRTAELEALQPAQVERSA